MADISNLRQFQLEVDAKTKHMTRTELVLTQKKLVFEALTRIVNRTPVDTGYARGNWQVTIGSLPAGEKDISDKEGGPTIASGQAALGQLPPFQVVYIGNNVIYIWPLEEGSSDQAPEGMVAITVEELRTMFK